MCYTDHSSLGDWEYIFLTQLIIIIKSEVSTLPIIVIFFRGCVSEVVVPSYVVGFIYIPKSWVVFLSLLCRLMMCTNDRVDKLAMIVASSKQPLARNKPLKSAPIPWRHLVPFNTTRIKCVNKSTMFWRVLVLDNNLWKQLSFNESRYATTAHYNDVIMSAMASQITSLTLVYSAV